MTTHSSVLTWKIPWAEEPHGLQSIRSQTVDTTVATEQTTQAFIRCIKSVNSAFFLFFHFCVNTIILNPKCHWKLFFMSLVCTISGFAC